MTNKNTEKIIKRLERLEEAVFGNIRERKERKIKSGGDVDFSLNERTFVRRYVSDKSGPKKFTLLLAYLTKGKSDKNVKLGEIRKRWNRMKTKSLLGKFNTFYSNDAKTRGWVDSREYGVYNLTSEWRNIL